MNKNIFLLPTDKPSRLHKIGNELGLTNNPNYNPFAKQQNIYITNNEEIKEGDWYYLPRTNSVYRCNESPKEVNLETKIKVNIQVNLIKMTFFLRIMKKD